MGLFGSIGHFLGKVAKGVGHIAGGVLKKIALPVLRTGASLATGGISERVIQGVNLIKGAGLISRAHPAYPVDQPYAYDMAMFKNLPPGKAGGMRDATPMVSPGVIMSISNPSNTPGRHNIPGGKSPHHHSRAGLRLTSGKRRRKRATSSRKRRGGGRKLKFGSPAYNRKYRHKRRRAA